MSKAELKNLKEIKIMLQQSIAAHQPANCKQAIAKMDANIAEIEKRKLRYIERLERSEVVLARDIKRLEEVKIKIKLLEDNILGVDRVQRDINTLKTLMKELEKSGVNIDAITRGS